MSCREPASASVSSAYPPLARPRSATTRRPGRGADHARPGHVDHARDLPPGGHRQGGHDPRARLALTDYGVEQLHAGRLHPDPHLAFARLGVGDVFEAQLAGAPEDLLADRLHDRPSPFALARVGEPAGPGSRRPWRSAQAAMAAAMAAGWSSGAW